MLRYAITDRVRFAAAEPGRREALLQHARHCAAVGIHFLQLREKDLPAHDLASLARAMLAVFNTQGRSRTRLLINSRADVAIATRADGVHLTSREGELTPTQVRSLYAHAGLSEPVVSVSCHTLAEVDRARSTGASLILFGPVFQKTIADASGGETLIAAGAGLEALRAACAGSGKIPVLALGGITEADAAACLAAGAAGVAGIRLFLNR
jgi:thiamine-phosphate pyrophosphorylase